MECKLIELVASFISSNAYSGVDNFAYIQLLSLFEQCHHWPIAWVGGVYLLYLLAYAFQYRCQLYSGWWC
jgi:hypothetical protein